MGKLSQAFLYFLCGSLIAITSAAYAESLSYSGRLVNTNGSPVVGPVNLKFDLASTADTSAILCSQQISNVALTNGVFHVKLDLNCGAPTLSQVLATIVSPDSAAIRVTNETASKAYSFQSLHAVPSAQVAHGLSKLNANSNEVLTWTGSKWEPKPVTGATGGTVTSISAGSGLSGGTITNSGTIAIASSGVTDSHLAGNIARSKLANGTANYVLANNSAGVISELAFLGLTQGGTGANNASDARTNLGLGTAATAAVGYASGNVLPADNIPVCLPTQKLQFTGIGPTYWGCSADVDTNTDTTKLPLAGGTMSGAIAMGNNQITGLAAPTFNTDAATKAYVDTTVAAGNGWTVVSGVPHFVNNNSLVQIGEGAPNGSFTRDSTNFQGPQLVLVGRPGTTGNAEAKMGFQTTTGNSGYRASMGMNLSGEFQLHAGYWTGSFWSDYPVYRYRSTAQTFVLEHHATVNSNFGVGEAYPHAANSKVTIVGATSNSSLNALDIKNSSSDSLLLIRNDGLVGIGNATPGEKLDVAGNIALTGNLRLKSDTANYVTLKAPNSLGATFNYTLPLTAPSAGQVLSSNAAGVMSWITPSSSPITTVFGRTGAVTAASGDYTGSQITNSPAGSIAATTVQGAIDELAIEKQAADTTLTSLAAYNTNGILVQTATDTFTGRSIAGVTNRTIVSNGDGVSGNPTVNVDTNLLPSPVGSDTGKFLKASGANTSAWSALAALDVTGALGFTPVNKAGDTISSGTFLFNSASILQNANAPSNLTDVTNKQYVDNQVSGAANQWSVSSGNVYRSSGNVGIGTSSPVAPLEVSAVNTSPRVKVVNTSSSGVRYPGFSGVNFTGGTAGFPVLDLLNSRGTEAAPLPIISGDPLGAVTAMGNQNSGSTAFTNAAQIYFAADANFSGTSTPASMYFRTTPVGSINNVNRMVINSAGQVGIGTSTPNGLLTLGDGTSGDKLIRITETSATHKRASMMIGQWEIGQDAQPNNSRDFFIFDGAQTQQRLVIGTTGYVGLGVNSPQYKLHVGPGSAMIESGHLFVRHNSNEGGAVRIQNMQKTGSLINDWVIYNMTGGYNNGLAFWRYAADGTNFGPSVFMADNGYTGFGFNAPTERVDVNGNVRAAGFLNSSDRRLKRDIASIKDPIEKIKQLHGVTYIWKDSGEKSVGFIAQEVEKIYPELVRTDKNGMKSVQYANLVAVLVEGFKKHFDKTEHEKVELKKEIDRLKNENEQMNRRLDNIEKQLSRQK